VRFATPFASIFFEKSDWSLHTPSNAGELGLTTTWRKSGSYALPPPRRVRLRGRSGVPRGEHCKHGERTRTDTCVGHLCYAGLEVAIAVRDMCDGFGKTSLTGGASWDSKRRKPSESYSGSGMHLPDVTWHTDMPPGSVPAANGDPFTCFSAPLIPLIVYAAILSE
jgi:hypothetical protein